MWKKTLLSYSFTKLNTVNSAEIPLKYHVDLKGVMAPLSRYMGVAATKRSFDFHIMNHQHYLHK